MRAYRKRLRSLTHPDHIHLREEIFADMQALYLIGKRISARSLIDALISACTRREEQERGLVAAHAPNPCAVHSSPAFEENPYPFMWYYRTELRNMTDRSLQIVWFEGYYEAEDGQWHPNHVLKRPLGGEDFAAWYTEGVPCPAGVIPPGATAVCDPNWHGSEQPHSSRIKSAYAATDPDGRVHYAEAVLTSVPIQA